MAGGLFSKKSFLARFYPDFKGRNESPYCQVLGVPASDAMRRQLRLEQGPLAFAARLGHPPSALDSAVPYSTPWR